MEKKSKKGKNKKKAKINMFPNMKKTGDSEKVVIEKLQSQYEHDTMEEKSKKATKKAKIKVFTNKKKTGDPEKVFIEKLQSWYENIDTSKVSKFKDLPLSQKTLKGLRESKYLKMTDIQRESIGLALRGKDILGAAQTGSGKTLAFLVPLIEVLYCKQWTRLDGVGGLVITPTRELAYQIFETLRKIGQHHDFSAGLIIGGKDLKFEKKRMDQCNIIICTPGRLLQHMDENPLFDCVNLQVLVLDEADRILDMGFKETMNAILANLPLTRQTMLFSATQTKSVKDLARLSLKDPSYVSVHESVTPKELKQSYVVCELHDKVSILWSFIRNHIKKKVIIFFATCKEVKFFYEIFCKLRPGVSLMALYGTLHQLRRMAIYEDFCRKHSAVLLATDLAARGLDFPEVHWVVQADCPEDADTYVHRVGRTARYHRGGESLLLLMPSELKMLDYLEEKKIPIEKIDINPQKLQNPVKKLEAYLAKDIGLKETAQRAFSHYARAVCFMKHKDVFNIQELDLPKFAHSIGLSIAPRIRFLERMNRKSSKNIQSVPTLNKKIIFNEEDDEVDEIENNSDIKHHRKNSSEDSGLSDSESDDFVFKNQTESQKFDSGSDSDDGDDILQMKRSDHDVALPTAEELESISISQKNSKKPVTKAALAKKMLKKKIQPNKKILFDEEGKGSVQGAVEKRSELAMEYENEDTGGIDIEKARAVLKEEDKFDKELFKQKVKAKHKEERRKAKLLKQKKKPEENEDRDEFGESEDDGEGPDLSWLPDPDKIFDKNKECSDQEDEEIDTSVKETSPVRKKKKKIKKLLKRKNEDLEETDPKPVKRKKIKKLKNLSETLDVNETEELALMLLRNE